MISAGEEARGGLQARARDIRKDRSEGSKPRVNVAWKRAVRKVFWWGVRIGEGVGVVVGDGFEAGDGRYVGCGESGVAWFLGFLSCRSFS